MANQVLMHKVSTCEVSSHTRSNGEVDVFLNGTINHMSCAALQKATAEAVRDNAPTIFFISPATAVTYERDNPCTRRCALQERRLIPTRTATPSKSTPCACPIWSRRPQRYLLWHAKNACALRRLCSCSTSRVETWASRQLPTCKCKQKTCKSMKSQS